MGDRHESDEEGIWRRCRVRSRPDANADPDSEPESVGTKPDTESEPDANACDANSGAIGITESEPNTVDISGADSEHDAGTESVGNAVDISGAESESVGTKPVGHADSDTIGITKPDTHAEHDTVGDIVDDTGTRAHADSDPEHAAPAVPTAGNRRRREQCDRCRGRASDCRSRHLLDAPPPDDTPRRITNLSLRGVSLID